VSRTWTAVVVRELDVETLRALARMLADHPVVTLARLWDLAEARDASRQERPDDIRPRTTGDLVTLLNAGVITMAEARRYLRLQEEDAV
jgi:hypothetical protein